jgi:aspartate ammonia-lyase
LSTVTEFRVERDLIGAREVPVNARYGVHAARAAENFARPGARLVRDIPEFCEALGTVKLACAQANLAAGLLPEEMAHLIAGAADELVLGQAGLREELVVPLLQGGAGTSTNMNVNEVLANRVLEKLGRPRGAYEHCHPNDHVNRSQSTNDVYPTALRLALIRRSEAVEQAADRLGATLREAATRSATTSKLGRTQLQDAVPMLVADEFHAWADAVSAGREALSRSREALLEVNLGGTAIGTGLTASTTYQTVVIETLAAASGRPVRRAERLVSATTDSSALLTHSAALRTLAVALAKLANDLRLLSSGPRAGLAELHLPPVQGGSSMMPGKINPVIAEFVNQLAFRVRGCDLIATEALDAGQLQLHAMLPAVAAALFSAQQDLTSAAAALAERCIGGVTVNDDRVEIYAKLGLDALTEAAAANGYQHASSLAVAQGVSPAAHASAPVTPMAPEDAAQKRKEW